MTKHGLTLSIFLKREVNNLVITDTYILNSAISDTERIVISCALDKKQWSTAARNLAAYNTYKS